MINMKGDAIRVNLYWTTATRVWDTTANAAVLSVVAASEHRAEAAWSTQTSLGTDTHTLGLPWMHRSRLASCYACARTRPLKSVLLPPTHPYTGSSRFTRTTHLPVLAHTRTAARPCPPTRAVPRPQGGIIHAHCE